MSMPRIPGQPGARQAKGYSPPKFAFRDGESLTAAGFLPARDVYLSFGNDEEVGRKPPGAVEGASPFCHLRFQRQVEVLQRDSGLIGGASSIE